MLPHPTIHVEMGETETPIFLEIFPKIETELTKFARNIIN